MVKNFIKIFFFLIKFAKLLLSHIKTDALIEFFSNYINYALRLQNFSQPVIIPIAVFYWHLLNFTWTEGTKVEKLTSFIGPEAFYEYSTQTFKFEKPKELAHNRADQSKPMLGDFISTPAKLRIFTGFLTRQ